MAQSQAPLVQMQNPDGTKMHPGAESARSRAGPYSLETCQEHRENGVGESDRAP